MICTGNITSFSRISISLALTAMLAFLIILETNCSGSGTGWYSGNPTNTGYSTGTNTGSATGTSTSSGTGTTSPTGTGTGGGGTGSSTDKVVFAEVFTFDT